MLQIKGQSRLLQFLWIPVRYATKRASGGNKATNNTAGRRLGPKLGEGQPVTPGQIIFRQRGTVWYPGENVGIGRDHTIFAKEPGFVRFYRDPFHPKRKFIGVALKPEYRLPTPHFEPRRRRLGFTPIDEPEIAEFEQSFFRKKEVNQSRRADAQFEQREDKRQARVEAYADAIAKLAPEAEAEAAAERLLQVFQFMRGGRSYRESVAIVDKHHAQDLGVALRVGHLTAEEHAEASKSYAQLVEASKGLMLSQQLEVVPFKTEEQITQRKTEIYEQLKKLGGQVDPVVGTSPEDRATILELLKAPELSARDVHSLKKQFLRRPVPVLATKGEGKFDAEVKAGKGKFMTVWSSSKRKMQEFYVPENAVMVF